MRTALGIVVRWGVRNGLRVNPVKNKLLLFRRNSSYWCSSCTGSPWQILGSDSRRQANVDIKPERKDEQAVGRNWELSPKDLMWIYTTIVRPTLTHCCVVWWRRLAGLCATGVKNTVATMALETVLNLPPLDLYVESLALTVSFNFQIYGY